MASASQYTMTAFVEEARQIIANANGDRQRVVDELTPLVERMVWDDSLFDESLRVEPEGARPRYEHHMDPDGALQVYVVEFVPGTPTPVHDHITWGLIGICGGQQRTERYIRTDDRSDPERATLEKISDDVLSRGAVYPLLPPDDIHMIETVGDSPSYSFHVLGADFGRHQRNIFDLDTGKIRKVSGEHM